MLLPELLGKLPKTPAPITEVNVSVTCSSCGLNHPLALMTGQERSTWETVYECTNGCGTAVILLAQSAPPALSKGRGHWLDGWKMRTALGLPRWVLDKIPNQTSPLPLFGGQLATASIAAGHGWLLGPDLRGRTRRWLRS
jgi:hypothetical protein